MSKSMLVNVAAEEEYRVAVVDNGVLDLFEIETLSREYIKGNIFKAIVEGVNSALEASFVNYGGDRAAFLPLDEINFKLYPARGDGSGKGRGSRITRHLEKGMEILVQVIRDSYANKPPTLSTYYSLPGRYLVLMPGADAAGISRKIEDEEQRVRLRRILEGLTVPEGFGVIVRTAGMETSPRELQSDLDSLLELWKSIERAKDEARAPSLIYQERDLVIRTARDHFTSDISEVLIDDEPTWRRLKKFFEAHMPDKAEVVKLYTGDKPIFSRFNLEDQIERIYKRVVTLKSGGSISIDQTEALTAIDVNSARSVRGGSSEETAARTNLEAADEIARQLRLRDIGGLIVIDFIDMESSRHIRQVERAFSSAMTKDKARYDVTRISKLGLMEVSRQRLKATKSASSFSKCPVCAGDGMVRTPEAAGRAAFRKIQGRVARGELAGVKVYLSPEVALYLLNQKRDDLHRLESRNGLTIEVIPQEPMKVDQFEIEEIRREEPENAPMVTADSVDQALAEGAFTTPLTPPIAPIIQQPGAQAAAEKMRKRLVDHGYWRAAVTADEAYDPKAGRMGLVFRVEPGERVELELRGEATASLRGRVRDLLQEGGLKSDAVEAASDLLEEEARKSGHRLARVSHREERQGDRLLFVYEVDAGPLAQVSLVRLEGNDTEGLERLVQTRAGAPLVDRRLTEDARALTQALEESGHPAARVDVEVAEGAGYLPVTFRVQAGPATRVSTLRVDSPRPLPAESAPQELRLREGGPYRVSDLARDRDTVLAAYRNFGYLQAELTPEVTFSDDREQVAIVLRVSPGEPTTVDHVVIAGLETTREAVVRRELAVKEGEPLGLNRVLESQRRLGALGLFDRITITEMDPESPLRRSVVVRAEEGPLTAVSYGVGYAERDKLRGSAEVTRRDLFGMDRSFTLFARASFQPSFRLLATFREPYFLHRKQELFVTGFREEEDRDTFNFSRTGLTLQTAHTLPRSWRLILRETYEETRTFDTTQDCLTFGREFCPGTLSGPSASLVHDTRDDPLDPRRGHFLLTDGLLSLHVLGGNTLVKGFVQASTYQLLSADLVVALSGRVGLARTFDPLQPLVPTPDRFFAGGDYSLRGFGVDQVRPDGGNALLLAGVELRRHLFRSFWMAAFAESGNVYPLVSDIRLDNLRYTAGLGLRYKSAVGPLRFDWGYKLNHRPEDTKSYQLHFTIGHAF